MHLLMPILAQQAPTATPTATLFQQLVFGEYPGLLITTIYSFIICATVFAGLVSVVAMFCIWWERKVAGHMQSRLGPNRVGPIGLLQSLADGIKLLTKEDLAAQGRRTISCSAWRRIWRSRRRSRRFWRCRSAPNLDLRAAP